MTLVQFVEKNAKRITRLEKELERLFEGTGIYTRVHVEQNAYRGIHKEPTLGIRAYTASPCKWYTLKDFPNMTAMIRQIRHDVKTEKAIAGGG